MARLSRDALFGSRRNPATGQYYSPSDLKRAFLGGGNVKGRGGALMVIPQAPLIQRQDDNLQQELFQINNTLSSIYQLLLLQNAQEKNQILAERERQRRLNESQIRSGQEEVLERKIRSTLVSPLRKIEQNVGGIFGRIGKALGILFLGWLTNQGIEALKAYVDDDKNKLEDIKNNILDKVGLIVTIFGGIRRGIGRIIGGFVRVTAGLIKSAAKLALSPFRLGARAFGAGFRALKGGFSSLFKPKVAAEVAETAARGAGTKVAGKTAVPLASRIFGGAGSRGLGAAGTKIGAKGAGKLGVRGVLGAFPIIGTMWDAFDAFQQYRKGNITGGNLFTMGALLSLLPFGLTQVASGLLSVSGVIQSIFYAIGGEEYLKSIKKPDYASKMSTAKFDMRSFTSMPMLMEPPPEIVVMKTQAANQGGIVDTSEYALTDVPIVPTNNAENIYALNSPIIFNAFAD